MKVALAAVRPEDEEAVAAISVALNEVLHRAKGAREVVQDEPRWRFSGRWWNKPPALRRSRPPWL